MITLTPERDDLAVMVTFSSLLGRKVTFDGVRVGRLYDRLCTSVCKDGSQEPLCIIVLTQW